MVSEDSEFILCLDLAELPSSEDDVDPGVANVGSSDGKGAVSKESRKGS